MPLLTPSRVAVVVLSLSLMSFLWTFGLPHQLAQPSLPIINHEGGNNGYGDAKPATKPLIPAPVLESSTLQPTLPSPDRPSGGGEHGEGKGHPAGDRVTGGNAPAETDRPAGKERPAESGKAEEERPKETLLPEPTALQTETAPVPSDQNATDATPTATYSPTPMPSPKFCKDVHGAPNVMIVIRTSKAESTEKLSTHLKTLLSCVPNFAIFSDHSGEIDGHPIHDALDGHISNTTKSLHSEFREYERIVANPDYKADPARAKELDKWKFLPMVYKVYQMKPHMRFYVFIEPDTSLSWTNLLQWMDRLDYRIPYYSGAPTFLADTKFAQRGSGILLSNGALRQYSKIYDERYADKWEARVAKECCGDLVLSIAMSDAHVEFYSAWPLLQGETPATLDYTRRHWCAPSVSWHHMSGPEIEMVWEHQRNWTSQHGWGIPYLIKDAYVEFVQPHIEGIKNGWDNFSQDSKIVAPAGRKQKLKEEEEQRMNEKLKQKQQEDEEKEKSESLNQNAPAPEPPKPQTPLPNPADPTPGPAAPKPPAPPQPQDRKQRRKRETIDWDKIGETIKDAADSAENCRSVCEKTEDCLQWRYTPKGDGECHLSKVIRLGKKTEGKIGEEMEWTSGWLVDRIQKVTEEWQCDKGPQWRFNQ